MSVECWVTTPAGTVIAYLERSDASPFRQFSFTSELNAPGAGSLEYAAPNAIIDAGPTIFDDGNLVWMRYRGKTVTWVIEQRTKRLAGEDANWITVSGRGTLQLLGDRLIWPDGFTENDLDPAEWKDGPIVSTTLTADALLGQTSVHVVDGHRFRVGQRISIRHDADQEWLHLVAVDELVDNWWLQFTEVLAHNYPTGSIVERYGWPIETTLTAAATAGASVLQVADGHRVWTGTILIDLDGVGEEAVIAYVEHHHTPDLWYLHLTAPVVNSYPIGASVSQQGDQYHTVVGEPAGTMLWNLIDETNARFTHQITQGVIDPSDFTDLWTQRFRFDNLLDVVADVTATYGDVEMEGLAFSYHTTLGSDLSAVVRVEEGYDLLRWERDENDRDTVTRVYAEGVGDGAFASFAIAVDNAAARRREAYLDAKDAANLGLLQTRANAALAESGPVDAVGLELAETRYLALTDYDLGDWIWVSSQSRGIEGSMRIVAMTVAETDDEQVTVSVDVASRRSDYLLDLAAGQTSIRRAIGTGARAPQAAPVPFPIDTSAYQLKSEKGAASGYAGLDAGAKVPVAQLGSGTPDGTKFLRDDQTYAVPSGTGAPTGADYLVGTAQGGLSAEIVVGTAPGGELGGTWASPTVDATHSGSAHHAQSHAHNLAGDGSALNPADVNVSGGAVTLQRNLTDLAARRNWKIATEQVETGDVAFVVSTSNINSPSVAVARLTSAGDLVPLSLGTGDRTAPAGQTVLGPMFSTDTQTGAVLLVRKSTAAAANQPSITMLRSRGTAASPGAVSSGDAAGALVWASFDGTNYVTPGRISMVVDGTPGTNDMPGSLSIWTSPDGSITPLERVRVDSTGNVWLGYGLRLGGVISPAQITADTDNYAPAGGASAVRWRLSTDASRNLTGIVPAVTGVSTPT